MQRVVLLIALCLSNFFAPGQERIRVKHQIKSEALAEYRSIEISVPAESKSYGVLYVLDGEYVFEYAEGAVSFLSNAFGHLPPLLVVSIPNVDRGRDMTVRFGESDSYQNFLDFISNELKPFVDSAYQTNGFDLLYGWSSASNINMQILAKYPNLFDAHIQSGTGIGKKTSAFLSGYLQKNQYQNSYLYANVEGSGSRLEGLDNYKTLVESIKPVGLKYKFEAMNSSSHVNVMAEGIYQGLQFVFEGFYIPDSIVVKGVEKIKTYYIDLKRKYNYEVQIPIGAFVESAGILFQHNPDEAMRLLNYGMELYPKSHDIIGSLGEIYEYQEAFRQAAEYYYLAHQAAPEQSTARQKYLHLSSQNKSRAKKSPKE